MINRSSFIVPEGFPFILIALVVTLLSYLLGFNKVALFSLLVTVFVACFFRNPERRTPLENENVLSPADGKVIKTENLCFTNDPISGKFKKVSIFMNIFNVHVNRIPCSGTVKMIRYNKGGFSPANLDKASFLNERNAVLIETDEGKQIMTVQVAGLIARRIVCWISEGMRVERGDRFGLIRFGSRLEVYLPTEAQILVKVGDKVKAGETPIGELS